MKFFSIFYRLRTMAVQLYKIFYIYNRIWLYLNENKKLILSFKTSNVFFNN